MREAQMQPRAISEDFSRGRRTAIGRRLSLRTTNDLDAGRTKLMKRVSKKRVTFHFPFQLSGIKHSFLPGQYTIETEEEPIPGGAVISFRPIETVLIAHPPEGEISPTSFWAVDPDELDEAIAKDTDQYITAQRAARAARSSDGNDPESE